MAEMPALGGRRARALITHTEKAKRNPPINPHPSADTNVKGRIKSSIILEDLILRVHAPPFTARSLERLRALA
jgi:hypothetical protein